MSIIEFFELVGMMIVIGTILFLVGIISSMLYFGLLYLIENIQEKRKRCKYERYKSIKKYGTVI